MTARVAGIFHQRPRFQVLRTIREPAHPDHASQLRRRIIWDSRNICQERPTAKKETGIDVRERLVLVRCEKSLMELRQPVPRNIREQMMIQV